MNLSLKLAALILLLALGSAGVFAVFSFFENEQRVSQRTTDSVLSLVATVGSMASTAAYVGDRALAEEVVLGLQLNHEIRCAEILTSEIHAISSDGCVGDATVIQPLLSPWDSEEEVGIIRVFKSIEHVDTLVRERFFQELSILIKVILIVSVSIFIVTHLLIAQPIARVSKKLKKVDFEREVKLLSEGGRIDELGAISRVINLMMVSAKKQILSEKILARKTEELTNHFRLIFQFSKNNLAVTDEHLRIKSFNPTFERMVWSVQPELKLLNSDKWIHSVTNDTERLKNEVAVASNFGVPNTMDLKINIYVDKQPVEYFYSLTFVKSISEDVGVSILFFIYDMTEHNKKLEKKEYEASHDNLTALYNRRAATKKIRHLLSSKSDAEQVAILFLDLDGFKLVNDELGHDSGDVVLKETAMRLRKMTRKTDIACRWGGDEFLVALNGITLSEASSAANKILRAILEPITLPSGDTCTIGCSIGLTLSTNEVCDFQTLYDFADKAMYRVKKGSKNAVMVHTI